MIEPIAPTDDVKALLVASELPIDDLDDPSIELLALRVDGRLAGVVGLQRLDGCALLRSLAVDGSVRSNGCGAALCDPAVREVSRLGRRDEEVAWKYRCPHLTRSTPTSRRTLSKARSTRSRSNRAATRRAC